MGGFKSLSATGTEHVHLYAIFLWEVGDRETLTVFIPNKVQK